MRCIALLLALPCLVKGKGKDPKQWDGGIKECFYEFGWDQDNSIISSGQALQNLAVKDLLLAQSDDGNLAVTEGDKVLWESGTHGSQGDYWSELSLDGFLATYMGDVDNRTELVWTSSASSRSASDTFWVWKPYDNGTDQNDNSSKPPVWRASNSGREQRSSSKLFFGLDCKRRFVAIVEGTPNNPGDWIWRQRVVSPTPYPTMEPTETPTASPTVPFAFYVMGDVPYDKWEEGILKDQIADMNTWLHPGASFTVHVGDFNRPENTKCKQKHFDKVYDILWNGPLPTYVLIGDNDYLECPSKSEAWYNYVSTFVDFETQWRGYLPQGAREVDVKRWKDQEEVYGYGYVSRPDMFAFYEDGILFISLALLNKSDNEKSDEFRARKDFSASWLERHVRQYYKDEALRGIVLFSHAEDSDDIKDFLKDDLKDVLDYYSVDVPVLYICGDRHRWGLDRKKYLKGLTYVQLDQGACGDPLLIEVAPVIDGETQWFEWESSSQYIVGGGLFRIDRQGGRYSYDECE